LRIEGVILEELILKKVDEISSKMIEDIIELVKIDSVETEAETDAPFGKGVLTALNKALEISDKLGFKTKSIDNYIGYAQYGENEDYICAIGHVDVVEVSDGWKQPPFSGYIENGTIYSRGVLDNKGPIISCLYALYALKLLDLHFDKSIRIIFGCDEESGFKDIEYYLKKEKPPLAGFTPDCKYPVVYSERGRAVVKISTSIKNLSSFFEFVNIYFISAKNTGDKLGIDYYNEEYGVMEMRNYKLSNTEDSVSFEVTLSYPAGITIEEILNKIKTKAKDLNVELVLNYNPVKFEKDSLLVQSLKYSYEKVTSLDGTPVTTTGGTYAKAFPNIVPFGPSFPGQKGIGHNPNEWMKIDDLITNAKIYALSLYKLATEY